MSDAWRIKSYYRPRILVSTQAVLESSIPDKIVCLTGGQVNLLRALLEYADRLSTFASEYHDGYYLCPSNEEWTQILDLVGQLSEELVGCSEIETLLQELLECCRNTQASQWPGGGIHEGQTDYDDYQSSVEHEVGDPPPGFPDWPTWVHYKCKAAQKIVDDMVDLGEKLEVWYSAGAAITFAVFQTMVLGTAIAPPVALVMAILSILAVAATAAAMIAFQNWLADHKQELVCEIHGADTEPEAYAAVQTYITTNWDLVLAKQFAEYLFSHAIISKCFDGGLDVSGYSSDYCVLCEEYVTDWDFYWPPDVDWTLGAGAYYDGAGHLAIDSGLPFGYGYKVVTSPPPGGYGYSVQTNGWAYGGDNDLRVEFWTSPNGVDYTRIHFHDGVFNKNGVCENGNLLTGSLTIPSGTLYLKFQVIQRKEDTGLRWCELHIAFT